MAEARTGKRFPVELPIRISVGDSADQQEGMTANVSAAGAYIRTESSRHKTGAEPRMWRPGSTVEFDMTLPADVIGAEQDVHIHCRGRVLRIEKLAEGQRSGVACVIDKYEFIRNS